MANSEVMRSVSDRFNVTLSSLFRIIQRVKVDVAAITLMSYSSSKPNNISTYLFIYQPGSHLGVPSSNGHRAGAYDRMEKLPGFFSKWKAPIV